MISVVISVYNEMKHCYLNKILSNFENDAFFELIFIDGGSQDGTIEYLKTRNINVFILPRSSRAARQNYGIQLSTFETILLHHPRSSISTSGLIFLKGNHHKYYWGGFSHKFDHTHSLLKFISWYSNKIRFIKKRIVYLDHCIFLKKSLLNDQLIPDISIFEDTVLSKILKQQHPPTFLPFTVETSSIRFLTRGIYKQTLINQVVKLLYFLKIPNNIINRFYEGKLNLNQN